MNPSAVLPPRWGLMGWGVPRVPPDGSTLGYCLSPPWGFFLLSLARMVQSPFVQIGPNRQVLVGRGICLCLQPIGELDFGHLMTHLHW